MVTKLAPQHMVGMVMGAWFVSIANANYAAGLFSQIAGAAAEGTEQLTGSAALGGYVAAFTPIVWMSIAVGGILLIASRLINKLMHGVT